MITINVLGIPRPGGSKKAFINRKTGKPIIAPANPLTAYWRADVVNAAAAQYKGELLTGAIHVKYAFRFPRPKSHYGTGKKSDILKSGALWWHTIKPDLTKIIRSTEDALTGIVWRDDSQVCLRVDSKQYCDTGEKPGVEINIEQLF